MLKKFNLLLLIFSTSYIWAQSILGPTIICEESCQDYKLTNVSGGLFVWHVDGARLNTNTGRNVRICWTEPGFHEIKIVDLSLNSPNPIIRLNVEVLSSLNPKILFPSVPLCSSLDSLQNGTIDQKEPPLQCVSACKNSSSIFSALGSENTRFEWTIEGALQSNLQGDIVNIDWLSDDFGLIKLTEINEQGCEQSIEYCIETLVKPVATISDNLAMSNPCVGQQIYLTAESEEAIGFKWFVNSVFYSSEQSIEYKIPNSDIQDIILITTSECLCQDTTYHTIIPKTDPGPTIGCVGTTCVGNEESYYAENICGTYNWQVSNEGTIIDGGTTNDDFITVIWNSGPTGEVFLSVSGCNDIVCNNIMAAQIPIIESTLLIEGPDVNCKSGLSIYTAPKYEGTSYNWSISGNGFITNGLNTNQITVAWDDSPFSDDNATISLTYDNCLLECGGSTSKLVELKPEFKLSSYEPSVCIGSEISVSAISGYNSVIGDWEVFDKVGNVIFSQNGVSFIRFQVPNQAGLFEVTFSNNSGDFCNTSSSGFLTALALPQMPLSFQGPTIICKNETYTYEASVDLSDNLELIWVFVDGGTQVELLGNRVNHTWLSNGPYAVELRSKNTTNECESEILYTNVESVSNATITGNQRICVEELSEFNLQGVDSPDITWTISPATAGNILVSSGSKTEIIFYESGSHQVTASICGAIINYNVEVLELPSFTVSAPVGICEGETSRFNLIADPSITFEILDEELNTVSTLKDFDIGPGIYTVNALSPDGCLKIEIVQIDKYDLPDIRISSRQEKGKCSFPVPDTLYALDAIDGYTYEWFKDGLPLSLTTEIITTSEFGTYECQVTNANGCINVSNEIKLFQNCNFETTYCDERCENFISCESVDTIRFTTESLGLCNTYSFKNNSTSGIDMSLLTYDFDDPQSGIFNRVTSPDGDHIFSHAGYYFVMLNGRVNSLANPGFTCDDYQVELIEVPVAANFEFQEGCSNTDIAFIDKSTFVNSNLIARYEWDFGDPASGANNISNLRNPTHAYSQGGVYIATLTIDAGTGCKARFVKEVRVLESPIFDLNLPFEQCVSEAILFEALDTGNLVKFIWEFDDPTGGNSNRVESASTLHQFNSAGIYSVSLTCQNNLGCLTTAVKNFEVGTNSLSGDIIIDTTLPVCEGDSVTLTAPNGGIGYLWSNGDVSQSIKVATPTDYMVTVINNNACNYVPDPILLSVLPRPELTINGITYPDNSGYDGVSHFDKLEICHGELFNLRTQYIFNATYLWSTGGTSYFINTQTLQNQGPGEYEVTVDVTTSNGCTFTSDPFLVIINPLPSPFTISSNATTLCEGESYIFQVDNPSPDLKYSWNTGQVGNLIIAQTPGSYNVTAVNKFGCERQSNSLVIHSKPNVSFFQTGCFGTCFPNEICYPLSNTSNVISWLKDGATISGENSNVLTVQEAGEYQIVLESFFGCIDTSDVLTMEAMPNDQSVSGLVFLDANGNQIYDASESLLDNINVQLMQGNNILSTSTTDISGAYSFDPITNLNTYLLLDTVGTNLKLTNDQMRYDLIFDVCIEDKIQDFPLMPNCLPIIKSLELIACPGEQVEFNGQLYSEGDSDMVTVTNLNACDTTFNLTVILSTIEPISLTTNNSCFGVANGTLNISTGSSIDLLFSIDNNLNYSNSTDYQNLSAGNHDVFIQNTEGCEFTLDFIIDESVEPAILLNPTPTCIGQNTGGLEITTSENGLSYSLDGTNFNLNNNIVNLGNNIYNLVVMDSNGCTYDYAFEILEITEPIVSFNITPSCVNENSGQLEIITSDNNLSYSIDGISFTTNNIIGNLPSDNFMLIVNDPSVCVYEYAISIPEYGSTQVNLMTRNSCPGLSDGILDLTSPDNNQYSLDGINYTNQVQFTGLSEGTQIIYIIDENGCQTQEEFEILTNSLPQLSLTTDVSCALDGSLNVAVNDGNNYQFSLTNNNYTTSQNFGNLGDGNYSLFVLDNNNCVHQMSFTIDPVMEPLLQFNVLPSCNSNPTGSLEVSSSNPLVEYSLDGINYSSGNIFQNLEANSYTLSVQDENNCIFEHTIEILSQEELNVDFNDPLIDCSMAFVELYPQVDNANDISFLWNDGSSDPSLLVNQSGNYTVEITNGCDVENYEWNIEFINVGTDNLYVPNVFSPNSDGNDDEFKIFKVHDFTISSYEFRIFDQWGNNVFNSLDFEKAWDGRFQNTELESGVYVWTYSMEGSYCNQQVKLNDTGNITLIR